MAGSVAFQRFALGRKTGAVQSVTPCVTRMTEEGSASLASVEKGGSAPPLRRATIPAPIYDLARFYYDFARFSFGERPPE
jgi:hypothetical protein